MGFSGEQKLYQLEVTLFTGFMQRSPAIDILHLHICSTIKQKIHRIQTTFFASINHRFVKWCQSINGLFVVDLLPAIDKKIQRTFVSRTTCLTEIGDLSSCGIVSRTLNYLCFRNRAYSSPLISRRFPERRHPL